MSKWDRSSSTASARTASSPGNGEQAVVFTEYADTADWLVERFTPTDSRPTLLGPRPHPVRDDVRDAFARRDFQVLVSTDAGNEGIDLQTAHVLVNWDIPWSLVRLEQRMGRIHRVGQTRDVELYNLVATDTREGDVLEVLLGNFVTAANQLDGRMFDSLSLVGELVGLTDDELDRGPRRRVRRRRAARAGARRRSGRHRRRGSRTQRSRRGAGSGARSASTSPQAVAALQDEQLDRINPAIVEAFLAPRIADGGASRSARTPPGEGMFTLTLPGGATLPREFAPPGDRGRGRLRSSPPAASARRSASSERRRRGASSTSARATRLSQSAGRAVRRRARASDVPRRRAHRPDEQQPTTTCSPIEADLSEAGGQAQGHLVMPHPRRHRRRPTGAVGDAREPPTGHRSAGPPHPARVNDARGRATLAAREEQAAPRARARRVARGRRPGTRAASRTNSRTTSRTEPPVSRSAAGWKRRPPRLDEPRGR